MLPYGRKTPLPFPFSQRSHVGNLRQTLQGKGVIHKRVETAGVYPPARFVCTRQSVQEKVLPGQGVLLRNSCAQHSLCWKRSATPAFAQKKRALPCERAPKVGLWG